MKLVVIASWYIDMPPRNGCHYAAINISMNGGPVGDPTNHNTDFAALAGSVRRGQVHTNSIEGTWAHLKLSLQAIYVGVSQKHLQHYCAEFAFRYNRGD